MMRIQRTSDGASIAYRVFGAPSAEVPVVFVHGWMASSKVWDPMLAVAGDLHGAVVDLRGSGRSNAVSEGITLERIGRDVAEVLDASGFDRVHLVGHSMGGQIALVAATEAPARVASLALVCPVPPGGLPLPEDVIRSFRAAGGNEAALGGILDAACKALDTEAKRTLVEDAMTIDPATMASAFDAWTRGGIESRLAAVSARTLVLATDDPFIPVRVLEAVASHIAGARLEVLRGPGHYPQVEAPRETLEVLTRFWKETAS